MSYDENELEKRVCEFQRDAVLDGDRYILICSIKSPDESYRASATVEDVIRWTDRIVGE